MSNSTLPTGIESAISSLRRHTNARLATFRVAVKYVPSVKMPEDALTVPSYRLRPNGTVDRVTQLPLVRLG
jgi:hypothetical protein